MKKSRYDRNGFMQRHMPCNHIFARLICQYYGNCRQKTVTTAPPATVSYAEFERFYPTTEHPKKQSERTKNRHAICTTVSPEIALFSCNSACRTNGFTSSAIDASIAYNVFRIAFCNSARRARICASTAFYAFIGNYMHDFHLRNNNTRDHRFLSLS